MMDQVAKPLQLECLVDRCLLRAGETTERYVRLTVQLPKAPAAKRLPVNLSLVLGRRGPMTGDKLRSVKRAVERTLAQLVSQDTVSIVTYDEGADVLAESFSVTPDGVKRAIERVDGVLGGNRTNLSLGWYTGCDQIANTLNDGVINRALVLVDGRPDEGVVDVDLLVAHARELRVRGITTSTFGVGEEFDHFLLQRLADAGGGHFYFIQEADAMPAVFNGELSEMLATVAKDVVVEVGIPAGAQIEALSGVPSESGRERRIRVLVGDAFPGVSRELVLRIRLPAYQQNQHLLIPVSLEYEDALEARCESVDQPGIIFETADDDRCRAQRVNEDVLRAACRCEVDRAKMEALYREYHGDVEGASATLRAAEDTLTELLPEERRLRLIEEVRALATELRGGMDAVGRKVRHYRLYRDQRRRPDAGNVPTMP